MVFWTKRKIKELFSTWRTLRDRPLVLDLHFLLQATTPKYLHIACSTGLQASSAPASNLTYCYCLAEVYKRIFLLKNARMNPMTSSIVKPKNSFAAIRWHMILQVWCKKKSAQQFTMPVFRKFCPKTGAWISALTAYFSLFLKCFYV